MPINVCCPYFDVLPCNDTDEHQHITCDPKSGLDGNPIIDNDHAKEYCLSEPEQFMLCTYFPKNG